MARGKGQAVLAPHEHAAAMHGATQQQPHVQRQGAAAAWARWQATQLAGPLARGTARYSTTLPPMQLPASQPDWLATRLTRVTASEQPG